LKIKTAERLCYISHNAASTGQPTPEQVISMDWLDSEGDEE
jgi:hypothetical protein